MPNSPVRSQFEPLDDFFCSSSFVSWSFGPSFFDSLDPFLFCSPDWFSDSQPLEAFTSLCHADLKSPSPLCESSGLALESDGGPLIALSVSYRSGKLGHKTTFTSCPCRHP